MLVKAASFLAGTLLSGLMVWVGVLWWAPAPLVAAYAGYELFFWWRGDRPAALTLQRSLRLVDPVRNQVLEVHPADVRAATVQLRREDANRVAVYVLLTGHNDVLFVGRFLVEPRFGIPVPFIDIDRLNRVVGSYAGVLRAAAPPAAISRQTFDDPTGQALLWLHQQLPRDVWKRTRIRVWQGAEPSLDLFGRHEEPPSGWLEVHAGRYRLELGDQVRSGALALVSSGRARRKANLLRPPDGADTAPEIVDDVSIPMLVLELDEGVQVAFPSEALGLQGPVDQELHDELLHTHIPEGAQIVWRIIDEWPETTWPSALRAQISEVSGRHSRTASRRGASFDGPPRS